MILYNEVDAFAAQWIRNAMAQGLMAPGLVDETDVRQLAVPRDIVQLHAFAGIGVWSHALSMAGWPDDVPVWTGSCPCQPFSAAGRKKGFDDARHLWPAWFRLIRASRPPIVFGEQVASPDGLRWLDAVFADLEGAGYSCEAFDLCAAGFGAPHIRQRLYFVAFADVQRRQGLGVQLRERQSRQAVPQVGSGETVPLADAGSDERRARRPRITSDRPTLESSRQGDDRELGNPGGEGSGRDAGAVPCAQAEGDRIRLSAGSVAHLPQFAGATRGFWSDADFIGCRDGKWRPVEPGTFPLAHGARSRVGRLRAHGNAIVPQVAAGFISSVIDYLVDQA